MQIVLLGLTVLLLVAKLAGDLAVRLRQPAVLGELLGGMLLSVIALADVPWLRALAEDPHLDVLGRLGILLLLFRVGLEATVAEMRRVGLSAMLVALIGVLCPFGLGYLAAHWLLPQASPYTHAFLGATLTATSVGITARVLGDLGSDKTPSARVILGAAVIDDVLGLVILAVVSGAIQATGRGGGLSYGGVALQSIKALGFLCGALVLGVALSPRIFRIASRLRAPSVLLSVGLLLCFLLSYLSGAVGLAPIVGAFAAGLVLEDLHYRAFTARGEKPLGELVAPIGDFLAPVFFVLMGLRTDLRVFLRGEVWTLLIALVVCAVVGKLVAGLGAFGPGVRRLAVGVGMVPRGEVGLIFVNVGLSLRVAGGAPVVGEQAYAAVVGMVIVTTVVTPPLLRLLLPPPVGGGSATASP